MGDRMGSDNETVHLQEDPLKVFRRVHGHSLRLSPRWPHGADRRPRTLGGMPPGAVKAVPEGFRRRYTRHRFVLLLDKGLCQLTVGRRFAVERRNLIPSAGYSDS